MNDCITTTKQSTTKPCAYFLGYTVFNVWLFRGVAFLWCGLSGMWSWLCHFFGRSVVCSIQPIITVYPTKYAHGFVVLCFVVVMQSFIMNSHEVFIHIHQGCFAGTGAIVRLPLCQWSKPDGYGKISQCITTTKHSKAKTVCIFLGIYCISTTLYSACAKHQEPYSRCKYAAWKVAELCNVADHWDEDDRWGLLYWHELTSISAWISDYIHSKVYDKFTQQF